MEFVTLDQLDTDLSNSVLCKYARRQSAGRGIYFVMPDGTRAIVKKQATPGNPWIIEKGAMVRNALAGNPPRLSHVDKRDIAKLHRSGMTMSIIATLYGVSKSYVSRIVNGHR